MNIEDLEKDVDASIEGIWYPFGPDAKVRIAQWLNKKHAKFMKDIGKKYGRRIEQGAISDKEAAELMAGQWEFIITGMEGFKQGGKPVKYSKELIAKWAQDKKLVDFFLSVADLAKDDLNYRTENIKMLGEASLITQSGATSGQESEKKD